MAAQNLCWSSDTMEENWRLWAAVRILVYLRRISAISSVLICKKKNIIEFRRFFMQGRLRGWRLEALSSVAALNYLMKNCIILLQKFHSVRTPAWTLCTVHTLSVLVSFPSNINVSNVRHAWILEPCSKEKKQLKLWLNKGKLKPITWMCGYRKECESHGRDNMKHPRLNPKCAICVISLVLPAIMSFLLGVT